MADYAVETRQSLTHTASHLTAGHDVDELLSHISEGYKQTKANQILRLLKDQDKLNVQFSECELLKEYDQIKEDNNARDSDTLSDDSNKDSEYASSDVHRPMPRGGRCKTSMGFHKQEQAKLALDSDSDSANMGEPENYMNDTRFNRPKSSYVRRRHYRKAMEIDMDVVNNTEEEVRVPAQQRAVRSARPKSRLGRSSIPESERVKRKIVLTEAVVNVPDEPVTILKEEMNGACNTYDRFANTRTPVNRSRREKGKVRAFCDDDGAFETHTQSVENMNVGNLSNSMDIREEITEIQSINTNPTSSIQSQMLANFQNSGVASHAPSPTYVHPPPHNSPVNTVSRKESFRAHGQRDQSPRYSQAAQEPLHKDTLRQDPARQERYEQLRQNPTRQEPMRQDPALLERYEQLRQDPIRQEPMRQEPLHHDQFRQEPQRHEPLYHDQLRQEPQRHEPLRQETQRHEPLRQEAQRHEPLRQEAQRYEPLRQEAQRHEPLRQEAQRHEPMRQEAQRHEPVRQEAQRHEPVRQEAQRHEPVRHDQLRLDTVHQEQLRTEPHVDYSQSRHDPNIHTHGSTRPDGRPTANDIISQNLRPESNSKYFRPKNPEPIQSRPMGRPEMRQNNRRRFQRRYVPQAPSNPHLSNVRPTSESVILARQKTEKNLIKAQQEDNRPKSEKIIINTASKTMLSVSSNPAQGPATSVTSKSGVTQSSHIQTGGYRGYDPNTTRLNSSRTHELQSELTLPRRQAPNNVLLGARQPLTLMKLPSLEASVAAKKKERALQIAARETCV